MKMSDRLKLIKQLHQKIVAEEQQTMLLRNNLAMSRARMATYSDDRSLESGGKIDENA